MKESVFSRQVHSVVSHPPRGDLNWQHFPTPGPAPTPCPLLLLQVDPSGSEGSHGGVLLGVESSEELRAERWLRQL